MPQKDYTLLDGVEEVAGLANPESPQTVSQRAFDEARPRRLFHPGLPRARQIAEQLGMKWRDVLEVAHAHDDERGRLLGARRRGPHAKWVTPGNAAAALAVAAKRLKTDSLTRGEYRREREKMLAHDAKQWMHGGNLRMPSDQQVFDEHGSWDAALRAAGLLDTTQRERKPSKEPSRTPGGKLRPRWIREDFVAAVERYLKETGRHSPSTGYEDWRSKQRKRTPSLSTIVSRYGWHDIHRDALDRLPEQGFTPGHPWS